MLTKPFICCTLRTIHILYIRCFGFITIHTTVKIPGNTTLSIIFILFITRHIIPNFIFTNTIPTFPAEITVFSIRAPVFKLSYTRRICPWYILFHIQDGKGSVYTRLRYPNQNTYKSNYFHTGIYVYIFILRKYNVSYKCNTIYKVQTTMPCIVWPIFTPP
ncbi:p110_11L_1 [African swine fever virus]|uniref:p110_11L_1 n=1 Tax=African swine fever virus TaxID=10497 RepID=A0A8A1V4G8_ASF|nr:p110_11L_1 [African swine fever virus]